MKRATTCRLRKVQCDRCGCVCRMTRSWMERGLPTCGCGGQMLPTSPADLAFIGAVTSADMSQAAWNAICRENGWDLTRNQGQASRRLSEPAIHAPTKPQCAYAGCGRWTAAGAEYCHEHTPPLEAALPF
jgi:hypothetical protein